MVSALDGKTAAGARVFDPRTWPTNPGEMPIILVQCPKQQKKGKGRSGAPSFDCIATIRVIGRVYALAQAGDAAATAALAAASALERQIEVAIVNDYALKREVQAFAQIDIVTGVNGKEGEAIFGETVLDFHLDFYQEPADFAPIAADPLDELHIFADLVNVFSPTGTFDETPFAADAEPDPRISGPDGRLEAAAIHIIPQD